VTRRVSRECGSITRVLLVFWGALFLVLGCGPKKETEQTGHALSERNRDSTIAVSGLPGGGAVGKALEVADTAAVRSRRLDEETH